MTATSLTPADLGLPPKFSSWRPGQWANIETAVETDQRFVAMCAPTGAGKSVLSVGTAIMTGGRAVYLTATKSLQDQARRDFSPCGMVDMRGRQNYTCIDGNGRHTCTEGRILGCRSAGCPYQANRSEFLDSKLGLTNYSYLLSTVLHSEGCGNIDLLILDEAHAAVQELSAAIEIHLNHRLNGRLYDALDSRPPYTRPLAHWRTWAKFTLPKAQSHLKGLKESHDDTHLALVDSYVSTLERMSNVPEDWILDTSNGEETVISPLWPTDYADKYLFKSIPRILLVSATIVPKTLQLLGIKEDQSLFLSQDHTFDPDRCPVYLFGPCRVDYKMSEGNLQEVVGRMDTIIRQRLDRKGIIHTTSYDRQNQIYNRSEHKSIIIAPSKASELREALSEFKASAAPRVLMSPAVTTGYDFPGSDCEYQILIKVPFIDQRSPVMSARAEADQEYLPYLTAQTFVQTCGRAMRCFDRDTELLTTSGWKKWDEVKEGDITFGIDRRVWSRVKQFQKKTVPLSLNKVLAVFSSDVPEEMLHIDADGVDAVVSLDHDMVIKVQSTKTHRQICKKPYGEYSYGKQYKHKSLGLKKVKASELPARFLLPTSGRFQGKRNNGQGCNIGGSLRKSHLWFKLIGLIISDGHISPDRAHVEIFQGKPDVVEIINTLIKDLGLSPKMYFVASAGTEMCVGSGSTYTRNYDRTIWRFSGYDAGHIRDIFHNGERRRQSKTRAFRQRSHKGTHQYATVDGWKDVQRDIPMWVFEKATASQLRALIEGMLLGDGSWNGTSGSYYTKERSIADRFQAAASLCGLRTNMRFRRGQIEIGVSEYAMTDCVKPLTVSNFGKALPWCVNTELGTVLVRRNGRTFIAGNSAADQSENFVLDAHANWFLRKHRDLFPPWFMRQVRYPNGLPVPPPPLYSG